MQGVVNNNMSDYEIGKDIGVMKGVIDGLISDVQILIKRLNIMQTEINVLKPKK